ncbi:hypothetical protein [Orbus mooreae]|uniref:hypothetical protein n=1 Tax=Orbus mooreae TaxID=3074107 RepID=UPI00370D40B2
MAYYFFINPIEQQYQQEQLHHNSLVDELRLLNIRINGYPNEELVLQKLEEITLAAKNKQINSIAFLSKIMSEQLLNHQLKLIDFIRQDDNNNTYLQFKIEGYYPHFIQFIYYLSQLNLNISISSISIEKAPPYLIFFLRLQYLEYNDG